MSQTEFMNTREVAEFLRIGERKVYDLVSRGDIPCTRVAGKWLFPRSLVRQWVLEHVEGGPAGVGEPRPPLLAGSHDPLLEWAVRESGCDLALMPGGSVDGLERFAAGAAVACGCHLLDAETGEYNVPAVRRLVPQDVVVLQWAWREQGLILPGGNPGAVNSLGDLCRQGLVLAGRQAGAGSRVLLDHLMSAEGLDKSALKETSDPARSETDVALAVLAGRADAGLGIAAHVAHLGLTFVPLHRERFDLVVGRRDYFEPPVQRLLAFSRDPRFSARAAELQGYDVGELGTVLYNSP